MEFGVGDFRLTMLYQFQTSLTSHRLRNSNLLKSSRLPMYQVRPIGRDKMLPILYNSPGFLDVPLKERRQAAQLARQRSFRHWQMWASMAALPMCVLIGSLIVHSLWRHKDASAFGAFLGLLVGVAIYVRGLYRHGLPYYRKSCPLVSRVNALMRK
jgi:hypothetical protein